MEQELVRLFVALSLSLSGFLALVARADGDGTDEREALSQSLSCLKRKKARPPFEERELGKRRRVRKREKSRRRRRRRRLAPRSLVSHFFFPSRCNNL